MGRASEERASDGAESDTTAYSRALPLDPGAATGDETASAQDEPSAAPALKRPTTACPLGRPPTASLPAASVRNAQSSLDGADVDASVTRSSGAAEAPAAGVVVVGEEAEATVSGAEANVVAGGTVNDHVG